MQLAAVRAVDRPEHGGVALPVVRDDIVAGWQQPQQRPTPVVRVRRALEQSGGAHPVDHVRHRA
ncbi:hypothetical protein [Curtobacterium sp. 24E2]